MKIAVGQHAVFQGKDVYIIGKQGSRLRIITFKPSKTQIEEYSNPEIFFRPGILLSVAESKELSESL